MIINYEDHDYAFELDDIDIAQATVIYRKFNLTLLALEAGLREGHPDALRAIYWLMLTQHVNIDTVNFKIVKFANAIQNATDVDQAEADPKAA